MFLDNRTPTLEKPTGTQLFGFCYLMFFEL